MFDFAWSEIIVIAVVALVVIGPKDLPKVLRTVGIWVGKARSIAREFQGSLDQMIREAELDEVRKDVEKATSMDIAHELEKTIDPGGEMKQALAEPSIADHSLTPQETTPLPPPMVSAEPSPPLPEPTPVPAEPDAEPLPKSGTHA